MIKTAKTMNAVLDAAIAFVVVLTLAILIFGCTEPPADVESLEPVVVTCEEEADGLYAEIEELNRTAYLEKLALERQVKGLSTSLAQCESGEN